MKKRVYRLGAIAMACGLALSTTALAVDFPETEPNDNKAGANVVATMSPGDTITGLTTGASTTVAGGASSDNYRITVAAPPSAGIWRYRMVITTAGTAGHTGSIRGLTQTAGAANVGSDAAVQSSSTATTPARMNQWYGLGGGTHQLYYRVAGGTTTTANYTSTLEREAVTPVAGPSTVIGGNVTISSIGQGHSTDTDFWVYDGNFQPVPTFGNDDESVAGGGTAATAQSIATRTLGPGTYYVAISNWNTCNDQPSPADDDFRTGNMMDFPNVFACSSTSTALPVNIAITGGDGSINTVSATKAAAYDVVWIQFTVVPPSSPTNPSGSGTATPANVVNDGASSTTLAVTVIPGQSPTSTAHTVTANSSLIVGGTAALLDNGVAPDAVAGDNIFTGTATIANGAPLGATTIPFTIQETAPQARSGSGNINVTIIAPPPTNDVCSSAITANIGTLTGDNSQATTDSTSSCTTSNKDLWYTFTAPSAGGYRFDTEGSVQTDTVLNLFDACGGTEIACDDDSGTGFLSSLVYSMTANQTVKIRFASFGATPAGGVFNLNINPTVVGACCNPSNGACVLSTSGAAGCAAGSNYLGDNSVCNTTTCPVPPPPANDECTGAVALTVGTSQAASLGNATGADITNCSGSNVDVWFSITPPAGAYNVITTPNSAGDDASAIAVFNTCPAVTNGEIACVAQPGPGTVNTVAFTADGTTTYYIRAGFFAGDASAFSIVVNSTVAGACCNTGTGACTITTTGTCAAGFTYLGDNSVCNTTTCPVPPPPANDLCANAITLTTNVEYTGTNALATSTDDGPAPSCQASNSKGVWFKFVAPASDVYGITTCGSNQDTVLTLFSGYDCVTATGTEIGCDDDTCDGVTPPGSGLAAIIAPTALTAGQTYYIRLSSFGAAAAGGSYTITVTGTAPTTGRCCVGGRCAIVAPASCVNGGGVAGVSFTAGATDCNATGIFNAPCCFADYNKGGGVTVQDIFDFLTDWFSGNVNANIAGDGTTPPSVQDIFDFLTAWFSGGC